MFKKIIPFILVFSPAVISIYSYQVPAVDNSTINFNNYRHKEILIVNTASNSNQAGQLAALQELYQQQNDSLVIIAFPSNSFGNEPKSDSALIVFMQQQYGIGFPIAAKSEVTGPASNGIYKWLANKFYNDAVNANIRTDFQKYLVDGKGRLVAQFDSSISPLSPVLLEAIRKNR